MGDRNVIAFPGSEEIGGYTMHPSLQEASRESARYGFERKLKSLFSRYAESSIAVEAHDRQAAITLTRASLLDAGLLFARVNYSIHGMPWKDAFEAVLQQVTSKPEAERCDAILQLLAEYKVHGRALMDDLLRKWRED